jgi:hypothetical protein
MKSFWKIVLLLIINIIVSVSATFAVLYYWENIRNADKPYTLITSNQAPAAPTVQPTLEIDFAIVEPSTEPAEIAQPTGQTDPAQAIPPVRDQLVKITQVIGTGDVNSETIRIVSNSDLVVNLENWLLEDADGNAFKFPNIQLLKQDFFIELYSRNGHNTPFELYWGKVDPVWQSGETVVLKDADGNIQSTYRVQ